MFGDETVELLAELVRIPSVNPMGRQVIGPEMLEARLTSYLGTWLESRGIAVECDEIAPGRINLMARYEAPGSRRTLLWDVHQDTVPVEGMTVAPFGAEVGEGRLYGRGACDVKGGMAAMLVAFARLVREKPAGSASVILGLTVDEEYTHTGSSRLAGRLASGAVDLAIVAEPTRMNIVTTHKGATRWKIFTSGRSCHSSTPHLGTNAIERMAIVIGHLGALAEDLSRRPPAPQLGAPSLSVGVIAGGKSVNIVPDACEIQVDRRLVPGEEPTKAIDEARLWLIDRGVDPNWFRFSEPWVRMPALPAHSAADWIEPVRDALAEALGRSPDVLGVPYGTDAGPLAQAGIPSLVLGPGDIAQAHTADEWIELTELTRGVAGYYALACQLG